MISVMDINKALIDLGVFHALTITVHVERHSDELTPPYFAQLLANDKVIGFAVGNTFVASIEEACRDALRRLTKLYEVERCEQAVRIEKLNDIIMRLPV